MCPAVLDDAADQRAQVPRDIVGGSAAADGGAVQAVDVLVVGAGPTGLTLAALLADQGVRAHVVEAEPTVADEPRAIALADESLRTAHALDILDDFRGDVVWNSGTCYLGARGQLLARVQPRAPRIGFPAKTLFDQPGYVAAALLGVARRASVSLEYRARVTGFEQDEHTVRVALDTAAGPRQVTAKYVIGCDGGRSAVRAGMAATMAGSSQTHPWIVLDTLEDPYDSGDTEFHCDPARPHVRVPGTRGRCRYEFMLLPGETPEELLTAESIAGLLAPYRRVSPEQIRRARVYVAHQLVARHWRRGRVFLAGDAAHLMPPFAGQGLNTGLRDARNLAWKLATVIRGEGGQRLLDSYESERRPHAEAMIAFSCRLGELIMTANPARARVRDAVLVGLRLVPPVRRYLTELRFVPRSTYRAGVLASGLSRAARVRRRLGTGRNSVPSAVGSALPQGTVVDHNSTTMLLDDVLGSGWALVSVTREQTAAFTDFPSEAELPAGTARVAVLPPDRVPRVAEHAVVAEQQAVLHAGPPAAETRFLLVRPDRYVAADFTAGQAERVLAEITRYVWSAGHRSRR